MGRKSREKVERKATELLQQTLRASSEIGTKEQMSILVSQTSIHEGPIPAPESIAKYEAILPGSADRLFRMAEKQMEHRQQLEIKEQLRVNDITRKELSSKLLGQIFAFIIALSAISCGTYLISQGNSTAGLVALLTPVLTIISVILYSKKATKA